MCLGLMLGFMVGKFVYSAPTEPESEPQPARGVHLQGAEVVGLPADAGGEQREGRAAGGVPRERTEDEEFYAAAVAARSDEQAFLKRETSWMKSQLFDVAVPDLYVTNSGQCFHVQPDCRGLRSASSIHKIRGCRHCAMSGLDVWRREG